MRWGSIHANFWFVVTSQDSSTAYMQYTHHFIERISSEGLGIPLSRITGQAHSLSHGATKHDRNVCLKGDTIYTFAASISLSNNLNLFLNGDFVHFRSVVINHFFKYRSHTEAWIQYFIGPMVLNESPTHDINLFNIMCWHDHPSLISKLCVQCCDEFHSTDARCKIKYCFLFILCFFKKQLIIIFVFCYRLGMQIWVFP